MIESPRGKCSRGKQSSVTPDTFLLAAVIISAYFEKRMTPMHQLIIRQVGSSKKPRFSVERVREAGAKTAPAVAVADPATRAIPGSSATLLAEVAWYVESYLDYPFGPNEERAARTIEALHDWGREAFERLFGKGQGRDFYRDATRDGHASLDLIVASDDAAVLSWPWEALRDPLIGDLAHHCRIERRLMEVEDPLPLYPALSRDHIHILLVTARPYEQDVAFRSISRPLVNLMRDEKLPAEIKLLRPPTFAQLRAELKAHPGGYHIVHFDGHGGFGPGARMNDRFKGPQGHLVFEKEDGSEDAVAGEQLSQLLREHRIPIVVLNACQSAMLGAEADDPFASVATSLLRAGVRSVVAMGYSLYVSAAKQFLPAFYERLFRSGDVSEATRAGRQAMLAEPERRAGFALQDWLVPVLYQQEPLALDFLTAPRSEIEAGAVPVPEAAQFNRSETPHGLIGRDSAILALERAGRRKPAGLLVHGLGGVGKTTLARGYIEWLASTQGLTLPPIWISFQGVRYVEFVLNRLAEQVLGSDALALPQGDKLERLRTALREQSRLIVWDNFESASGGADGGSDEAMSEPDRQQLKRLLEDLYGSKSKILITSRTDEAWLGPTACFRVPIGGLMGEERHELARAIVADLGIRLDPSDRDTADLIDTLEGHPLMMRAILPRLSTESASRLMDALARYVPDADSTDEVERKLYATLRYVEEKFPTELRPLLIPIGLHASYTDAHMLGQMAKSAGQPFSAVDAARALGLLEVAGLVQGVGGNIFRLHPALTRYLEARGPFIASDAEEVRAWERGFVDIMAHAAQAATPMPLHEQRPIFKLFGGSFNRALRLARADGWPIEDFGALTQSFASHAHNQRNFAAARGYYQSLAERTEQLGMNDKLGAAYHQMGLISQEERDFTSAEQWFRKALALVEATEERQGLSSIYHQLGILAQHAGDLDAAEEWNRKSLSIDEELGTTMGIATSYRELGNLAQLRGDLDGAETWNRKALDLSEKCDDPIGVAGTHHQLGIVAMLKGDIEEAKALFQSAADTFTQLGDDYNAAKSLHQLGSAELRKGDPYRAEEWLLKSLAKREAGDKGLATPPTYMLLGIAKARQGDLPLAIAWFRKALEVIEQLNLPGGEVVRELLDAALAEQAKASDG
jgi:tetratricopeptide (TPR) repeat protein